MNHYILLKEANKYQPIPTNAMQYKLSTPRRTYITQSQSQSILTSYRLWTLSSNAWQSKAASLRPPPLDNIRADDNIKMRAFCTWRVVEIRFRQYDNNTEYGILVNSAALDTRLATSFTTSSDTAPKDSKARGIKEELISVQRLKYLVFLRRWSLLSA